MINFSQVCKTYPHGYSALKDITFTIAPGELVFVAGHSGAGKSTLLKLIAGIELPTRGSVIVNGQNLGKLKRAAMPYLRRNFGLVFQQHKLLFDRNVFGNVALPLEIAGFERSEAARRVRAALDKVGLLSKEKAWPVTLSGGEQQRLCIARAVVNRPSCLIADEPTANLDAGYANDIMSMFQSFNQVGVAVIIATHDHALIGRLAPRLIALKNGELAA